MRTTTNCFMLLLFLLIVFSVVPTRCDDNQNQNEKGNNGDEENNKYVATENKDWKLNMVYKLRFDHSKNFMGSAKSNMTQKWKYLPVWCADKHHIGKNYPNYINFFDIRTPFVMNQPNMNILFIEDPDIGSARCHVAVYEETQFATDKTSVELNNYEKCVLLSDDGGDEYKSTVVKPFCTVPRITSERKPKMIYANGTYNSPSKPPPCLFDFYEAARRLHEYDFFKYCAKAYFFQGKNFDNPDKLAYREDFLLYLTEGQLVCNISESAEVGREMLAKGYKVRLVQRNYRKTDKGLCAKCPNLMGIASSYEDKRTDGKFFLGAVFGGIQLEGSRHLWAEDRFKDILFKNDQTESDGKVLERMCYYLHDYCLRIPRDNRYVIHLEIEHFCTGRGMRQVTAFDVSIGPEQSGPDHIYEDTKVRIFMSDTVGLMVRSTGQTLQNVAIDGDH